MSAIDTESEELCYRAGRLDDKSARAALLRTHSELLTPTTVTALAESIRTLVRVDLPRAAALAETAVTIAGELNQDQTLGLALRAKANTMWFMGDCRAAVAFFDRAAGLLDRAGNLSEVGRTLSSSIQSRLLLGDYESAHRAADRAREIFQALGERARVARVELNVANILHRQNRFKEALHAYERAYVELLPHKDVEGISVALHNIAVCLIALDDYSAAHEVYTRMRRLCEENEMPQLVAQADYNIAYLHFLRGEYSRALELLHTTKELCQSNGDNYHLGLCDLDASEIYLALNLKQDSADAAQSSLRQFELLGMNYETVRSQLNLAVASSLQGEMKHALELFRSARESALREENEVLPALIDLYTATTTFEQGGIDEARELCLRALDVFQSAALPGKHVAGRLLLGRIYLASQDTQQAGQECEYALRILEGLDAPLLRYQAEFLCGQILEVSGQRDAAYDRYQRARSSLETLRSSLQGDELRIGFMRNRTGVYERLVQICLDRDSEESSAVEAFGYVEAAKSRTLQDLMLAGPQPNSRRSDSHDANSRIRDLRRALNWYYHLIEREQYSADRISQDRVQHLREQCSRVERELCRSLLEAPITASVAAAITKSGTATVSDVRTALGKQGTLLEYFAVDGLVHAIVVSPNAFKITPVARVSDIIHDLRMVQFQISKFRLDPAYVERFASALVTGTQSHLRGLYTKLVEPIRDLLATPNLAVVPFGPLHSLPFHALFDGRDYLIDSFRISYGPSATVLANSQARPSLKGGAKSLVLGIDDPRIPSVRKEIEAVAALLPEAKLLWAEEATQDALREYGASSRIIHIASHGYFRPDNPMFSAIRLADSYLTLHDLYRMNLPAELLALSGCVTGLNVIDEGDELIGLSRGLLYAGARSSLLSLWEVDDRSTCDFMRGFYGQIAVSANKAAAARLAMLELRESRPHPYHWAAFKLIGAGF